MPTNAEEMPTNAEEMPTKCSLLARQELLELNFVSIGYPKRAHRLAQVRIRDLRLQLCRVIPNLSIAR